MHNKNKVFVLIMNKKGGNKRNGITFKIFLLTK